MKFTDFLKSRRFSLAIVGCFVGLLVGLFAMGISGSSNLAFGDAIIMLLYVFFAVVVSLAYLGYFFGKMIDRNNAGAQVKNMRVSSFLRYFLILLGILILLYLATPFIVLMLLTLF